MPEKELRPGYRTTEFWLTAIAEIVGLLLAGGILSTEGDGAIARILGTIIVVLAALGYTVTRASLK